MKVYTTSFRLVKSRHYENFGENIQIVYDSNVARYTYTINDNVCDRTLNYLANGLYYYVIEANKSPIIYRVIGKFIVLR